MIPPDVDIIVSEHHERPDGTGFPQRKGYAALAPLSSVFIVAHDLVSYILNRKENNWNIVSFLNQHRFLYQSGIFHDLFVALWNNQANISNRKAA